MTPLRNTQKGFTLLETMVAMVLFGIASVALTKLLLVQIKANNDNEIRTQAMQAAQLVLDRLRTQDPATMPTSNAVTTEAVDIDDRNFSVSVRYCPTGTIYCTAATMRHLRASVSYRNRKRYEVDTVFTQLR